MFTLGSSKQQKIGSPTFALQNISVCVWLQMGRLPCTSFGFGQTLSPGRRWLKLLLELQCGKCRPLCGSGSLYLGGTLVFSWLDLLDPFVNHNHLLSSLVSHVYALKVKYVF